MIKQRNRFRMYFIVTLCSFTLSSLALCLIPFLQRLSDEIQKPVSYTVAALFWFGIISGLVSVKITSQRMCKYRRKLVIRGFLEHQTRPGIITFSCKVGHLVLYIITGVGAVSVICDLILHCIMEYLMFPIIAITFLSFVVHCIIDGKYYKTYNVIKKEGIENEC